MGNEGGADDFAKWMAELGKEIERPAGEKRVPRADVVEEEPDSIPLKQRMDRLRKPFKDTK